MKNKTILLLIAVLLGSLTLLLAQGPGARRPGPRMGMGSNAEWGNAGRVEQGQALRRGFQQISDYLGLTAEQREAFKALIKSGRETMAPLRAEIAENRKQMVDLLESGSTDAAAIGALAIKNRDLHEALQQSHAQRLSDFKALLDTEQQDKYDTLVAMSELDGVRRAFRQLGLLGAGEGPDGFGPRLGMWQRF